MSFSLRLKRVVLGSSVTLLSKAIGTLAQLATTAFVARNLSPEAFGIWALLLSLVILSACFDFGLGGPVLRNLLTESTAKMHEKGKEFFFAAFHILFVLYFFLGIAFLFFSPFFPFASFFHLQDAALIREVDKIFGWATFFLCLRIPFALNIDAFYGCHETHIRGILDGIEAIILSVVAIVGVALKCSFFYLVYSYFSTYALFSFFSFLFFLKRRGWRFSLVPFRKVIQIVSPYSKMSLSFWLQNIFSFFLFYQLPFFIAHFIGLIEAGEFSLIFKLFSIVIGAHFAIMTPLWGNYKEAFLTKEIPWIQKTLKKTLFLTALSFIVLIPSLVIFHPFIIKIWVSKSMYVPFVILLTGSFTFLYALMSCYSTLLNAMSKSGVQAVCFGGFFLFLFFFSPIALRWGINGIVGLYIVLLTIILIVFMYYTRHLLQQKGVRECYSKEQ